MEIFITKILLYNLTTDDRQSIYFN